MSDTYGMRPSQKKMQRAKVNFDINAALENIFSKKYTDAPDSGYNEKDAAYHDMLMDELFKSHKKLRSARQHMMKQKMMKSAVDGSM